MIEVRRTDDNELCGFIEERNDCWFALTVFGSELGKFDSAALAKECVLSLGIATLAERWQFRSGADSEWQTVCIQEANPDSVRIALGYYSLPGVPTLIVTRDQLVKGICELKRS